MVGFQGLSPRTSSSRFTRVATSERSMLPWVSSCRSQFFPFSDREILIPSALRPPVRELRSYVPSRTSANPPEGGTAWGLSRITPKKSRLLVGNWAFRSLGDPPKDGPLWIPFSRGQGSRQSEKLAFVFSTSCTLVVRGLPWASVPRRASTAFGGPARATNHDIPLHGTLSNPRGRSVAFHVRIPPSLRPRHGKPERPEVGEHPEGASRRGAR